MQRRTRPWLWMCLAAASVAEPATIGYWRFEEALGDVAHDSSGGGILCEAIHLVAPTERSDFVPAEGVFGDGPLLNKGSVRNGLNSMADGFPGTITVSDITVEAFVYLNQFPEPGSFGVVFTAGWYDPEDIRSSAFELNIGPGGLLGALTNDNDTQRGETFESTVAGIETGRWHHIAFVKQGGTARFYVNHAQLGDAVAIGPQGDGDLELIGSAASASCRIGIPHNNSGLGRFPDGWFDEIRVSDRALSPSEMLVGAQIAGFRNIRRAELHSVELEWWSSGDAKYAVYERPSMDAGAWSFVIGDVAGEPSSTSREIAFPPGSASRVYRVHRQE